MTWNWARTRTLLKALAAVLVLAIPAAQVTQARMAVHEAVGPLASLRPSSAHPPELPNDPDELKKQVLALREANHELAGDLAATRDRLAQVQAEAQCLGRFKDLARVLDIPSARAVSARIVRRGTAWNNGIILIDCGRRDGIEVGCGVLAGPAVMGLVIETGEAFSRVALLSHEGVQVDARIVETRQTGMAVGHGATVTLDYIGIEKPRAGHPEPQPGQVVVTAGLDGVFPAGLLLGSVAEVTQQPDGIFYDLRVNPAARFGEAETVIVLKRVHIAIDAPAADAPNHVPVWQ